MIFQKLILKASANTSCTRQQHPQAMQMASVSSSLCFMCFGAWLQLRTHQLASAFKDL